MSNLWGWTLSYSRGCGTQQMCVSSQGLRQESAEASTGKGSKSSLERSLVLSRPLDRRLHWPVGKPHKSNWEQKLLPRLQKKYNGWGKEDPPTTKQLQVEADDPKLQAKKGCGSSATELKRAIGDLSLITFYHLFCIGEYTVKGMHNATKKTIQFNYEDITFFKKIHLDSYDTSRGMHQHTSLLPRTAG
jgi:hypothetical protein